MGHVYLTNEDFTQSEELFDLIDNFNFDIDGEVSLFYNETTDKEQILVYANDIDKLMEAITEYTKDFLEDSCEEDDCEESEEFDNSVFTERANLEKDELLKLSLILNNLNIVFLNTKANLIILTK